MGIWHTEKRPQRGRPKRSEVDRFQAMAWYNSIADVIGTDSAYQLEKLIEPGKVVYRDGKVITSRAWDKYKNGDRLPQDGYDSDGKPRAVVAAEMRVPESGDVYRHLIWEVMRKPSMRMDEVIKALESFKPSVAAFYFDLSQDKIDQKKISLGQNLWRPLPIKYGDYYTALDHLAVNLMFLRLDIWGNDLDLKEIALNIANALPSVAISPWIGSFHKEMFDWLESNVWGGLFNTHYGDGRKYTNGWKKVRWDEAPL